MKQSGVFVSRLRQKALLPLCVLACITATETKGMAGEASLQPAKGAFGIDCSINTTSKTIGLRYFLSDAISVRPSVSFDFSNSGSESSLSPAKGEIESGKYGFQFDAAYHFVMDEAFSLYSGLSYGYTFAKNSAKVSTDAFDSAETRQYVHTLSAMLGFQYMLTRHFGLFVEASIGLQNNRKKNESFNPATGIVQDSTTLTSFGVLTSKGTLGAVFYF